MPDKVYRKVRGIWLNTHFKMIVDALNLFFAWSVSTALVSFLIFSEVPIKLLILPVWVSTIGTVIYALVMALIPLWRSKFVQLHMLAAPLAVFVFSGRGLGFLEIVVSNNRYDLISAVLERLFIIFGLLIWHSTNIYNQIAKEQGLGAPSKKKSTESE